MQMRVTIGSVVSISHIETRFPIGFQVRADGGRPDDPRAAAPATAA